MSFRSRSALIVALTLWAAAAAAQDTPPPATTGQMQNVFNPAISLIGNFLAVAGSNPVEDLPSASMRESELGFQAIGVTDLDLSGNQLTPLFPWSLLVYQEFFDLSTWFKCKLVDKIHNR